MGARVGATPQERDKVMSTESDLRRLKTRADAAEAQKLEAKAKAGKPGFAINYKTLGDLEAGSMRDVMIVGAHGLRAALNEALDAARFHNETEADKAAGAAEKSQARRAMIDAAERYLGLWDRMASVLQDTGDGEIVKDAQERHKEALAEYLNAAEIEE